MADDSVSLAKWREYFRTANFNIFTVIEHAIVIAASDYPYDFKVKRDRIAELLFTCKETNCLGCDRVELTVPNADGLEKTDEKINSEIDGGGSKDSKESKANSCSREGENDIREVMEMNANLVSNYDAEALNDEMEEESQTLGEVLRIKEIMEDGFAVSEELLFECLRRIQLMNLPVEILKATTIGLSVNAMRKHRSKEIRNLVRTIIEDWKIKVDAFVSSTRAFSESVKTSVDDEEEGLPSPPLDEGIFFATPSSMELSQFFDGIDDDGNPKSNEELHKNRGSGRRPTLNKIDTRSERPRDSHTPPKDKKIEPKRNPEAVLMKQAPPKPNRPYIDDSEPKKPKPNRPYTDDSEPKNPKPNRPYTDDSETRKPKPNRPYTDDSEPRRPMPNSGSAPVRSKPSVKPKVDNEMTVQQKSENRIVQRKPMPPQHEVNCKNESFVGIRLEVAKRKLQERYQEAENAKKQRTIQVVELCDLPKTNHGNRNQTMKPGNHNRQQEARKPQRR